MVTRRWVAALGIALIGVLAHVPAASAQAGDGPFATDSFVDGGEPGACSQLAGADWWELKAAGCAVPNDDESGGEAPAPPPPPPPGPADLVVSQPTGSSAIVVENRGPGTATGVVLRDTYSSSIGIPFPGVATSQGSCTAPPVGTPVGPGGVSFSCDLGSLVPGGVATVTIYEPRSSPSATAAATSFLGGFLSIARTNTASVSGSTPDPNPDNNTSSLTYLPSIRTADFAPPPPDSSDEL